ncbi:MAG TPA: pilin, partial [Burkholderiales bacterium]|nr:pilin [Burkholderiales bacterium]
YQSGNSATQAADSWGCEVTTSVAGASQYVASIHTTQDGLVQIAIQGFAASANINGTIVTLAPMKDATNVLTKADVGGTTVYAWRCGSTVDGTNLNPKFLPGSCRG